LPSSANQSYIPDTQLKGSLEVSKMPIRKGADYIKGLQDGREVWHAGRRIENVTKHAGFTGTIKTLGCL
jgi:hypothetical protein